MVGFAVGTALARAIKLVLIAALYIGRVDTPLLAPGVGVGPLRDTYPFIFRQDILALEGKVHESFVAWIRFALYVHSLAFVVSILDYYLSSSSPLH